MQLAFSCGELSFIRQRGCVQHLCRSVAADQLKPQSLIALFSGSFHPLKVLLSSLDGFPFIC